MISNIFLWFQIKSQILTLNPQQLHQTRLNGTFYKYGTSSFVLNLPEQKREHSYNWCLIDRKTTHFQTLGNHKDSKDKQKIDVLYLNKSWLKQWNTAFKAMDTYNYNPTWPRYQGMQSEQKTLRPWHINCLLLTLGFNWTNLVMKPQLQAKPPTVWMNHNNVVFSCIDHCFWRT